MAAILVVTLLSAFHRPVRVLLGDFDPDIHLYDGDQINDAIKTVVELGKVPGFAINDEGAVEPDLTPSNAALAYALLVFHTAKRFAVAITSSSFSSRAFSERLGEPYEMVADIIQELYQLENGDMAS